MPATIDALLRSDAVHRAAYVDPGVFALEESRIFRRVWLYVAHESEVARAGDYVLRRMGPEEVVLVRREDGGLSLLYNRCAHRGARLVTELQGSLRQFRCPYHAWTYRLDGSLVGVPLASGYTEPPSHGMARVPRLESYKGFVFGSHAAAGESLTDFLGALASAFDNMLDRAPAGTLTRFGGALRLEYRGNWKMFMENAVDLVHPTFVHRSSVEAARDHAQAMEADALARQGTQMFTANAMRAQEWEAVPLRAFPQGHVYMGGFYRGGVIAPQRDDPVFDSYRRLLVERHGEEKAAAVLAVDRFNNLVWPNLSVNARFAALRVVHPLAAGRTVVEVQCFRLDGAPPEMHDLTLQFVNLAASPASLIASDDLEVFERCQRGLESAGEDWIDIRRGAAADRREADGSITSPGTSEVAIRTQFAAWRRCMSAE